MVSCLSQGQFAKGNRSSPNPRFAPTTATLHIGSALDLKSKHWPVLWPSLQISIRKPLDETGLKVTDYLVPANSTPMQDISNNLNEISLEKSSQCLRQYASSTRQHLTSNSHTNRYGYPFKKITMCHTSSAWEND